MIIKVLFARFAKEVITDALLEYFSTFVAMPMNTDHLMAGVVKIPVKEFGNDVGVPKLSLIKAQLTDRHENP